MGGCCTTSHHRQVIDRLYAPPDRSIVYEGTELALVPNRAKDLIEYAIPRVFKLPTIGSELESRIMQHLRKHKHGFVLVGLMSLWKMIDAGQLPFVGYFDKNVLAVMRALLEAQHPYLLAAAAHTYVKVLEAQNEILVNFSQFDEFLKPMLSLCSFQGTDASLTPLVHKAGLRALATLLACRSKVPAGDDPSALALDTIVPVVLRVLHSPQGADEKTAFDNAEMPQYPEAAHALAQQCLNSISGLANNPVNTTAVLNPMFAFLDECAFQPVSFALNVCLSIQAKTSRPVWTHLLQYLKRLDAQTVGLAPLPEGQPAPAVPQQPAQRVDMRRHLDIKTAVLTVIAKLVESSNAYLPAESFTLLVPQLVFDVPARQRARVPASVVNAFNVQASQCLQVFADSVATLRGFVDSMALLLGELESLATPQRVKLLQAVLRLTTSRLHDDDVFVIKDVVPLLATTTDQDANLRLVALQVWFSLLPYNHPRDWSHVADARETARIRIFLAALFHSAVHSNNTGDHIVVLSGIIRKLLRCYGVSHQVLLVPWALAVQDRLKELHWHAGNGAAVPPPAQWAPAACRGHQLVAAVLAAVAAELPCERLDRDVRDMIMRRQAHGIAANLSIARDGSVTFEPEGADRRPVSVRPPPSQTQQLSDGTAAPAASATSASTANAPDMTYWRHLGGTASAREAGEQAAATSPATAPGAGAPVGPADDDDDDVQGLLFSPDAVATAVEWASQVRNAMDSKALRQTLKEQYTPDQLDVSEETKGTDEVADDFDVAVTVPADAVSTSGDEAEEVGDYTLVARPVPVASADAVLSCSFSQLVEKTQRVGEQQVIRNVLRRLHHNPRPARGAHAHTIYADNTFMAVTARDLRTQILQPSANITRPSRRRRHLPHEL